MTITEFLLARIAEDEAAAKYVPPRFVSVFMTAEQARSLAAFKAATSQERMLAECAAKRAIVSLWEYHRDNRDARRSPRARMAEDERAAQDRRTQEARARVAEDVMFSLAAVYADHPDYQQEWARVHE